MMFIKKQYDFSQFKLFEKYGIFNFNDISFSNFLNQIISDIFNGQGEYTEIYYKDNIVLTEKLLTYTLDWCKSLHIFYSLENEYTDSFVISKPGFSTKQLNNLFKRDNFILNTGSIVINIESSLTRQELRGILKHEIKHLYYYLKTNISTDKSNKDILFQEGYEYNDDFNFYDYLKLFYSDSNLLFFDKLNENTFKDLLVYSLYYLNLNECRSMIENINEEIKNNISNRYLYLLSKQISQRKNIDFNQVYLIRVSETFAAYMFINDMLSIFKDSKKYKQIYDKFFYNDFQNIYGVKSLYSFCVQMINRINKEIINKSHKLISHYLNNKTLY